MKKVLCLLTILMITSLFGCGQKPSVAQTSSTDEPVSAYTSSIQSVEYTPSDVEREQGSDKQLPIYKSEGASYNGKYYSYYSDEVFSFKVFDEATKKSEYLCKKSGCIHNQEDKTCNSYSKDTMGFIPVGKYLYVFVRKFESVEPGHIDIINLETGEREQYLVSSDFGLIYNAYAVGDMVYFTDQCYYENPSNTENLSLGYLNICAIKIFDINKKTIEFIANEKKDMNTFSYISAIEDDTLYYQEYYQYIEFEKQKAGYRPKNTQRHEYSGIDFIDSPSFYYYSIDDTSLFTYNLNTSERVKTASGIENFGLNYYKKGFYFLDEQNNTHRIDWLTGEEKIVVSAQESGFGEQEICELNSYVFNGKLSYITYDAKLKENSKTRYIRTVTGRRIYDIEKDQHQNHDFDNSDLQYITIMNELNDGFIAAYKMNSSKVFNYGYILKQDYYAGRANFVVVKQD